MRISSPPVKWPCFYGIDFATRAELIANGLDTDDIRRHIGADSLGYISLEALTESTLVPAERLCRACFTGEYPVALPDEALRGKHALEQPTLPLDDGPASSGVADVGQHTLDGADGLAVLVGGAGGSDALTRP